MNQNKYIETEKDFAWFEILDCNQDQRKIESSFKESIEEQHLFKNSDKYKADNKVNRETLLVGIVFMLLFVLWTTVSHVLVKYLMVIHPYIRAYDVTYAVSIVWTTIYYWTGKLKGVNMNLLELEISAIILIIIRVVIGALTNILFLIAISKIVISKAVLIFSLNPIFGAIQAIIILNYKLNLVTIISCICASWGIYLLTLKSKEDEDSKNNILGYTWMICSAILMGSLFVWLRYLFKYNVNVWIISYYATIGYLIQSVAIHIISPSTFQFDKYELSDIIILILISIFACLSGLFISWASKYGKISQIAPLNNLENILTILADIFIFHYSFSSTDGIGMLVIFSSIAAHIVFSTYYRN